MDIVLKGQLSGTRNGEDWPAPGTKVALPDDEARQLITQGMAVVPDPDKHADLEVAAFGAAGVELAADVKTPAGKTGPKA